MKIRKIHDWDVADYHGAVRIQESLRPRLILGGEIEEVGTVAGADISYARGDDFFYAAVVLLRLPDFATIEESSASGRVSFPYVPGLLSFREGPILLKAFEGLQNVPDLVLIDGQGIAHPRGLGLAAHMGLFLDVPTVGCAKTRLVGTHGQAGPNVGDWTGLFLGGEVVGAVLRTKRNVNPIFVSPGHRVSLEGAVSAVVQCLAGYRIPEPVRRAHLAVNTLRRKA
ncbi:MAG TPA: deoxyribonuclease V [Syntrophales bacterium]|nr:deoxyribonuclease V [Syntrophales bacterium]